MKLKSLLLLSSLLVVVLTTASIIAALAYQKNQLQKNFKKEIDVQIQAQAGTIAKNVYLMINAMREAVEHTMKDNLHVASDFLAKEGSVAFDSDDNVVWQAENQYTGEVTEFVLPKVSINGVWLGQNRQMNVETAVVDKVKSLVGGTCTIFQRMNEQGDMLRIATNVENSDGSRAIGTYIPRNNPDGSSNPVIETIMQGKVFYGSAYVVNAWYVTAYKPLYDDQHRVAGVLYVGVRQDDLTSLHNNIMNIVVGKTGYVAILRGKGRLRGKYIISQHGERDGENIYNTTDASGKYFIRRIIDKALHLVPSSDENIPVVFDQYAWQNPGETRPRDKAVAITYFAPWDWVILAGYYRDDFRDVESRAEQAINQMMVSVFLVAGLAVLLALVLHAIIANHLFVPLGRAVEALRKMSQGHLDTRLVVRGSHEIHEIGKAFNSMADNLQRITASRDELNNEIQTRQQAEISLLARENQYKQLSAEFQSVLDSIQDSLLLISPELKIIWVNKSASLARGIDSAVNQTGSNCYKYWFGKEEPCDNCVVLKCFETGEPQNVMVTSIDGKLMGVKAFPVRDSSGRVVNVLELASDITETVRLREEAARNSQLASLGELAAGMAHEINNPNGLIMLNLSTLKEVVLESLDFLDERYAEEGDFDLAGLPYSRMRVEVPQLLTEMQEGTQHIKRIVDDLKDFVRREETDFEETFALNDALEAAIRLLGNKIKKATDSFSVELDPHMPLVLGNAHRIEQVAMNLLVNSAQALTDRSQSISLKTFCNEQQGYCGFEVRDEGVGIDQKDMAHLTDPFFTTKRATGGTGLGLSVSARIVKEHHGSMRFSHNIPQGMVVRVTLPSPKRSVIHD